jgi:osmotically-inducible protein OsmY
MTRSPLPNKPSSLGSRSSDGLLTTKVKTQLLRIKGFDPTRVKVVTERGVVYLMGFLNRDEGNAVAAVAHRVGGVQKVVKLFEYRG